MIYRHECKFIISKIDIITLRQRLKLVMKLDDNAIDGKYFVRSLYFDTPTDTALKEKIDGVSRREKFRIRYYNFNANVIKLEKKIKINGVGNKLSVNITKQETEKIIKGDIEWLLNTNCELLHELYYKIKTQQLQPKTIVDYNREPYIYRIGNVRVTLDYNIRTGLKCIDFFNPDSVSIPINENHAILEIKWDNFLPDIIKDVTRLKNNRITSFSKYAQSRMYD